MKTPSEFCCLLIAVAMSAAGVQASAASSCADVLKVSSLGWRADDSTAYLQSALDSGAATVVVDRVDGPWVTRPLFARSNQTIVSPETLRDAQKHPEKYENLQVRVAGWNIRWNDIPRKEQDEYIARIETAGGCL